MLSFVNFIMLLEHFIKIVPTHLLSDYNYSPSLSLPSYSSSGVALDPSTEHSPTDLSYFHYMYVVLEHVAVYNDMDPLLYLLLYLHDL